MQINKFIPIKYIESIICSFFRINDIYIVIHALLQFHFTDCSNNFTPVFLMGDNQWISLTELIGKNGI